jgi:hypothetical protein
LFHSHYVGGALVDTVTGVLLAAGLAVAGFHLHRRAERLLLIWFGGGLLLLALSNFLPQPQLTRLLYLMPAAALLVGLAVAALARLLHTSLRVPRAAAHGLALALLVVVPPLNLHQLLVDSPVRLGANDQIMLMKAVQEHPARTIVEVAAGPLKDADAQNALLMFGMYPWLRDRYRYVPLTDFQPPDPQAGTGALPIYLVDQDYPQIMELLAATLPPPYQMTLDTDPGGGRRVWLFQPDVSGSP